MITYGDLDQITYDAEVDGELVAAIVHDRIVEGLFPLLLVPEASYVFEAGVEPPNGAFERIDGDRAIEEARQRLDDWTAIARTVRSLDTVVALATALPSGSSDAVVTAAEWPVLARADGNRTLGELVRVTGMSAFAVCSAVHRLVGRGLLVALDA